MRKNRGSFFWLTAHRQLDARLCVRVRTQARPLGTFVRLSVSNERPTTVRAARLSLEGLSERLFSSLARAQLPRES